MRLKQASRVLAGVCVGVLLAGPLLAAVPATMTSEQDHGRMMRSLGIQSLRPGADPSRPDSPNAANADEAKASPYASLPDPLVMNDGTRVTTAGQWWQKRRPELVELFDREIYGRTPADTPRVTWAVAQTTRGETNGIATITRKLIGHVDNSACPEIEVNIDATLTTRADAAGPAPVVVELGFNFPNRRPVSRVASGPATRATLAQRPTGPSWQEQVLRRGYGYAIIYPTSYQADNGAGLTRGIIGLCNKGQPRKPDDWGTLKAWAWGVSRLIDYFETEPAVDPKRVCIEGLSRFGKAAAVAMAYEPRLAVGFIGSSGQGGVKIMRRDFGERVENIASAGEYQWMAGNYLKYAGPLTPNDLPIDAHELVALCAPRPVFISVGSLNVEGKWIDAKGNFLGGVGAGPVYELLGKKSLGTNQMPAEQVGLTDGDLAFRMHEGGHTTGPNWPSFLDWSAKYLAAPPKP